MDNMYYRRNRRKSSRSSSRSRSKSSSKGSSFYLFPFLGVLLVFIVTQIFSSISSSTSSNTESLDNALIVKAVYGDVNYVSNDLSGSFAVNDPVLSGYTITVPFDSALVLESNSGSKFRIDQSSNFKYDYSLIDSLDTIKLDFKSGRVWVKSNSNQEQIILGSSYLDVKTQNSIVSYKSNLPEFLSVFSGQALAVVKDSESNNEIDKFRVESNTSLLLDNKSYSDFLVNKAPLIKTKTSSDVYLSNWYKWNTFYDNNNVSISFDDIFEAESNIAFKDLQEQIIESNKEKTTENDSVVSIDKSTTPYFTYPKPNEVVTEKRIKLTGKVPANTSKVMIISYENDQPFKYILKEFEANTEDFVYYAFSDPQRGNLFPGVNKFDVVAIDTNGNESPSSSLEFVFRDPDVVIDTENESSPESQEIVEEETENKNDSPAGTSDVKNNIENNLATTSNLALPLVSTVNDKPYVSGFRLSTNRAYIVGSVPQGASKVTVNGFDLTMFKKGQTRFHYILSEGFSNLKNGENKLVISYEKDGQRSPSLEVVINYNTN